MFDTLCLFLVIGIDPAPVPAGPLGLDKSSAPLCASFKSAAPDLAEGGEVAVPGASVTPDELDVFAVIGADTGSACPPGIVGCTAGAEDIGKAWMAW